MSIFASPTLTYIMDSTQFKHFFSLKRKVSAILEVQKRLSFTMAGLAYLLSQQGREIVKVAGEKDYL